MLFQDGKIADDLHLVAKAGFNRRIREALSTVSRRDGKQADELDGFTELRVTQ